MSTDSPPAREQGRRRAIGGDFEDGAPAPGSGEAPLPAGAVTTSSGRGAIWLALRHLRERHGVGHAHLPAYVCDTAVLPARALGLEVSFYPVDDGLRAAPRPPAGAAVLLVHYFGWLNPATDEVRARAAQGEFFLLEDASQAVLSTRGPVPAGPHGEVGSLRKFGPAPLGGWTTLGEGPGPASAELLRGYERVVQARALRAGYLARPDEPVIPAVEQEYLDAFASLEAYLDAHPEAEALPPRAADRLAGPGWGQAAEPRRANWLRLRERLAGVLEPVTPELGPGVVPLGYVVRPGPGRDRLRARLAAQRIFCPVHWPLPAGACPERFPAAASLAAETLTLPIDQRYAGADMDRLARAVREALA